MIKDFFKNLLLADVNYAPRFINDSASKKSLSITIAQDVDDYKHMRKNFDALPMAVKARYAYAIVSSK